MDLSSHDQTLLHSAQLQHRAFHFFRKLALRTRGSGRRPKDVLSPSHNFQRAHSSVDLLRKPDICPLVGLAAEDGHNPMDTDDSSPDPSADGNLPRIRSRCHSAWDSFHAPPTHPTFAGRGPAQLFFRDQAGPGSELDSGNVLAPAPLFLRSTLSLDVAVQPSSQPPILRPDATLQINVTSEPEPHGQAVHNTLNDDTPRPLGDDLSHNTSLTTSLADPTPISSHPGDLTRSLSAPLPTPEMIPERPVVMPHHSAPLPPPFRLATERGLRLSPSVVARQPIPILNLPTLPPPSSPHPAQDSPPRRNVPLRSMPSLSRHGRSSSECQADDENAILVDSDEEEEGEEEEPTGVLSVHQSDEEDEESHSTELSGVHSIKSLQKRPVRREYFFDALSSPQSEPTGSNHADYFNTKTSLNPIQITTSPISLPIHTFSPKSAPGNVNQCFLNPRIRGARKPSLYRVASRSMIDLGVTHRVERGLFHLRPGETVATNLPSASGRTSDDRADSEESETEMVVGRLLRRTSMPNFHPTSDPPPYPTFNPRESRDMTPDEEQLPPYSNSLYLLAIMPRKVEFTSPGVQAKDRKWRRVVCELEGTTFRVYKCPPGTSGAGVLGDWWEKRVGVGNMASPDPPRTRKKEEQLGLPTKLGIDEVPTQPVPSGRSTPAHAGGEPWPRTESQSSIGVHSMTTPRATKRISGASFLSPFRSSSTTRSETNAAETATVETHESHSSLAHELIGRSTPAAQRLSQQPRSAARLAFLPVGTGRAQLRNGEITKPPQSDLIRAYTLQHAESGLGNDYLKRKNVIRVRLEGEQFLLQAPDTPAVVEWIEGLHAGTSIALDLDQRPMPRGPLFPRRRRRRARRTQGEERTL